MPPFGLFSAGLPCLPYCTEANSDTNAIEFTGLLLVAPTEGVRRRGEEGFVHLAFGRRLLVLRRQTSPTRFLRMTRPGIGLVKKLTGLSHSNTGSSQSRTPVCLVLGGTGLLGKALQATVHALEEQAGDLEGYRFVFVGSRDADLRLWSETQLLFQKHQPSAIIHLAAKEAFLRENLLISTNVIPRAVFCLSTCAYPEAVPKLPLVEEYLHIAPAHPSNEGYAAAKRLLEQQVRFSRQRLEEENPGQSFTWICVIPCNLYGPHDNFNLNTAHVLPALVHKALLAKQSDGKLVVRGTGRTLRQFLFSDDAARLLLLLLVKREIPQTHCLLNMCPDLEDSEISISNLALIIKQCSGLEGPLEFDEVAPEGVLRKASSVTDPEQPNPAAGLIGSSKLWLM
ncbi:putative GDP-L-fucose synthetase [Cyclospora cayetanensis]|uniref:GDP-L-fucose synthetase n=1 Tax=Cyclospora cayetanensis TaxID=88456 RepID=A0A1D3D8I2_9EIME|nr:putative GDP-L-fucose synthetase [Cyclospora cayetanensis]